MFGRSSRILIGCGQRLVADVEHDALLVAMNQPRPYASPVTFREVVDQPELDSGWMEEPFVPPSFEAPLAYAWSGLHLEPLGEQHNDRDHAAWMSSIDHIRSTPGFSPSEEPSWPVAMTVEENLADLVRHAQDFKERRGFTYSILEGDDVIGCVYIYPDRHRGYDAVVTSWVRESRAELDADVREALSAWIDEAWPFENPYFAGRA